MIDSFSSQLYMNGTVCKLKKLESYYSSLGKSQKIVTDEDKNKTITAAEILKKFVEVKNFIKVNGSDYLNIVFNKLMKHVEQTNHVGGYCLVPSSIQPRDVTCSILYSNGSFRFRPVSRTGNF